MAVILNDNEVVLSGVVGGDSFWDDGFSSADVIGALAQIGNEHGRHRADELGWWHRDRRAAIHAALARHKGAVTIVVEGIAASAASLLAMAGDTITMTPGSIMMIHDPAFFTMGDVAAHEKTHRL
jgi:ATP-dependent Clp protease protease subunit